MTAGGFQPLAEVRILDLSRYLPGPLLTRILADLGAEVIKVEAPAGDPTRMTPPFCGGHSAAFAGLNFGKRGVAVDLKKDAGAVLVRALAAGADVLVETFRPGVLDRLGLGYEVLAATQPRIIYCSISGYGQHGALRDVPGHDIDYLARSGVLGLFGPADGPPTVPGVQIADVGGGSLHGVIGVLAALLEREQTGRGRHLDISMARAAATFLALEAPRQLADAPEPRGAGMLTGGLPCYRVYATKDDRYMAVGALEPKFFAALCAALGVPHLGADGFAGGEARVRVVAEIATAFAARTQAEWVEVLAGVECCCEAVRTPAEALADASLGIGTVDAAGARGIVTDVGGGVPGAVDVAVPTLGGDSLAVCREFGVADEVVQAALAAGALVVAGDP